MKTLAVLCCALLLIAAPRASADTILVFGQSTGLNLFTGNETGGTTVLDANNIPITITALNSVGTTLGAFFNFDAISTALATNVPGTAAWTQPYQGDFEVTSGVGGSGFNYLSGSIDGLQFGLNGGQSFTFSAAQPPLFVDFTSDVPGMALALPRAFALSLTNVVPGVLLSNGSFGDFTANVSGTASAGNASALVPVPEPMSFLLMGSGFGVLGALARKRKKTSAQ